MKNISERKQEAIKNAWVALITEDKYPLLKHDDNGWSDWRNSLTKIIIMQNYTTPNQDGLKFEKDSKFVKIIANIFGFDLILITLDEKDKADLVEFLTTDKQHS